MTRKIYYSDLVRAGVCDDGLKAFHERWPQGAEVNEENCAELRYVLNFQFGAEVLLKGRQQELFVALTDEERAKYKSRLDEIESQYASEIARGRENMVLAVQRREAEMKPLVEHWKRFVAVTFAQCYNVEE